MTGTFTAPVLDADPEAAAPWLVTAYLPGLSLRDAVETFGRMPPDAVRALAAGLAEALAAIHRAGRVEPQRPAGITPGGFSAARPNSADIP